MAAAWRAALGAPGDVETAMAQYSQFEEKLAANPHYTASYASVLSEPVISTPDDIADAVVWLTSDASRCMTGTQLRVDMGTTLV